MLTNNCLPNALSRYHRKAEELLQQGTDPGSRPGSRSSEFEEFVLTNREVLEAGTPNLQLEAGPSSNYPPLFQGLPQVTATAMRAGGTEGSTVL